MFSNLLSNVNLTTDESELVFQLNCDTNKYEKSGMTHNTNKLEKDGLNASSQLVHLKLTPDFYSWLATIEQEQEPANISNIKAQMKELKSSFAALTNCETKLSCILESLELFNQKHLSVAENTNSLYQACNHISDSQQELIANVVQIENNLNYFSTIDSIENTVSNPKFGFSSSFGTILTDIDSAIKFFVENSTFKDSAYYLKKARSCLSKCLSLIKSQFCEQVNSAFRDYELDSQTITSSNTFMILFGKFHLTGTKLRPSIKLLEERTQNDPSYDSTLQECIEFLVSNREKILLPVVKSSSSQLIIKHEKKNCVLLRTVASLLSRFCDTETKLFLHFFSPSKLSSIE
ncbi:Golgi transport complex subunit 3 [Cichlidogyrus casuarinus]|uniref:Conserved oligomeric Golgi complex subunit 3 n=1 Tax=Cichlidogyrus casuarinus TaxID=1844966 RepID=A0ABD2PX47_9PLAT